METDTARDSSTAGTQAMHELELNKIFAVNASVSQCISQCRQKHHATVPVSARKQCTSFTLASATLHLAHASSGIMVPFASYSAARSPSWSSPPSSSTSTPWERACRCALLYELFANVMWAPHSRQQILPSSETSNLVRSSGCGVYRGLTHRGGGPMPSFLAGLPRFRRPAWLAPVVSVAVGAPSDVPVSSIAATGAAIGMSTVCDTNPGAGDTTPGASGCWTAEPSIGASPDMLPNRVFGLRVFHCDCSPLAVLCKFVVWLVGGGLAQYG